MSVSRALRQVEAHADEGAPGGLVIYADVRRDRIVTLRFVDGGDGRALVDTLDEHGQINCTLLVPKAMLDAVCAAWQRDGQG